MSRRGSVKHAAFGLSLIAGILMLIDGIVWIADPRFFNSYPGMGGLNPGISQHNFILAALTFIFGIIILVGSYYIYLPGGFETEGGIMVAIFSLISITAGGGFIVGAVLGLLGGILSIYERQETVDEATIKAQNEEPHEKAHA